MGTEQEIFDSVNQDDEAFEAANAAAPGAPETPVTEQAAPTPPQAQAPVAAPSAAPQQEPTPPPVHQVPLTELLNTRERAQAAERERDEFKKRWEEHERQQRAAAQQPKEMPDVFADPQGWQQSITQTFDQRLQMMALDNSLNLAEVRHGETFSKAYEALLGSRNPALVHQLTSQPNPGEAIVGWFKREQVISTVGDDPAAYESRLADKLLNDPAFQAKVVERLKAGGSQPSQGSRPSNVTRLPSLTRATSAAPAHSGDDDDGSEDAIWDAARSTQRR